LEGIPAIHIVKEKEEIMRRGWIAWVMSLVFVCSVSSLMAAETGFPTRTIEILCGYAPGGGTDLGARMVAEMSRKYLGQEVIVTNKPGGAGRTAMTLLAKARPDGYTLGASTCSALILSPLLEKVPYKPFEDYTFLIQFGILDFGIAVAMDSPFKTYKDMLDFARANPDKLTVSVTGQGNLNYYALQAIALLENIKIKIVPFNSVVPAFSALLGGHVMVASTASSGYAPHYKAKSVRLLAVFSDKRMPGYPDVPTLKELGYPSLVFQSWYLFSGPKNMDKAAAKKIIDAFRKAMQTPEYKKMADEIEVYTDKPLEGDELREGLQRRNGVNAELFKKLGLKAQ
jgi:tripartite-type tricarboxylate transporter receptor subunit TctC